MGTSYERWHHERKKKITEVCRRYTHLGKQNAPLEFINSIVALVLIVNDWALIVFCLFSASDSGSTPIRSACYIVRPGFQSSHYEIVKCLVKNGADLSKSNHYGGTCQRSLLVPLNSL